ncbi:MAG: hypothetical protein JWN67_1360 [Actinomycetia bacterium]|nr:hypothetical protein [Actinomycetes bacterium]
MRVIVLLPPSEGKATGGRGSWSYGAGAFGDLALRREQVAEAVVAQLDDRKRLFGTDGVLADRAVDAARALAAGAAPSLPAWRRFTGVVWEHLDPATLPPSARRRIVVPSAQLGLVRGDDQVPDFRLKFSVSAGELGRLDRWWRKELTEALARTRGPIVDLLPNEHAAALDLGSLGRRRRVVRVSFLAADGAGAAGHAAKAVKGSLARAILLGGLDAVDGFTWQGWTATRVGDEVVIDAP